MIGIVKARVGLFAAAFVAAGALVGGCEKQQPPPASPAPKAGNAGTPPAPRKRYVVGMIAKSQTNEVFKAARQGAEDAARELSGKYGVEIRLDWRTPVSEDAQKQAENIRQLVSGGANGILISATNAATLLQDINAAVDRGVPVMTFDSDVPQSKRFAYFGSDDGEAGRGVMRELASAMGGKGVVAILAGTQGAPNLTRRVEGVREELKNHADISLLNVFYHEEAAKDAVAKMEEVQQANPQITGWALVGGWPLFTQNALDKIAPHAKVVSVDALRPQLPYLKNGQVQVLLAQQVYEWGSEGMRIMAERLIEQKAPADPIIKAPLTRVSAENADEYGRNWARWLGEEGGAK
ncbi:MAG: sugar ABC transporter substrate-binding protein [Phycisphaerae bacterium]|nr:sugar ABC transporter substrate-binding protein [Phycisphaerae bacterium]